jgi:1-acyl-sn-glycerol-3-phosphate acyltransferase
MIYPLVKLISKIFLGKLEIAGKENIPCTGPVVVVANHTSLLDGFLLTAFYPRRITFLSAAYLFKFPLVGAFLRALGAIPVQNEGSELAGMRAALRVLQSGCTLALFPEGHICQTDKLGPFQTGWAYLALKAGAQVLPVVIKGTSTALPIGPFFPRYSKIYVQIAAPWTLEKVQRPGRETLTTLNTRLNIQMQQMLSEM